MTPRSRRVSTVAELKAKLPWLRDQLKNDAFFPKFFAWAYDFSCEPGQKSMPLDGVRGLLSMLITPQRWPLVADFDAFLATQSKTVSKDTWVLLLELAKTLKTPADATAYDDSAAWPVMFDDFVEFERKRATGAGGGGKGGSASAASGGGRGRY
jgi:hypothetical protein